MPNPNNSGFGNISVSGASVSGQAIGGI